MVLVLASCSKPSPAPVPKKSPVPVKTFKAYSPTISVTSNDGKSTFVVHLEDTDIKLSESGEPEYGKFRSAKGEIWKDKILVCKFQGDEGYLNRDDHKLELTGNVKIKSELDDVELLAKNVHYFQEKNRIEANGSVMVSSPTLNMGPMEKVIATPDLKKIATPGKFK